MYLKPIINIRPLIKCFSISPPQNLDCVDTESQMKTATVKPFIG